MEGLSEDSGKDGSWEMSSCCLGGWGVPEESCTSQGRGQVMLWPLRLRELVKPLVLASIPLRKLLFEVSR